MRVLAASMLLLAGCAGAEQGDAVSQESSKAPEAPANRAGASPVPSVAATKQVDCTASEETVFSCAMPSGKRLAVCAPPEGPAQYRFGGEGPELVLTGGTWASAMYSGGGEAQIAFANGDTHYIVFSRMVRTHFAAGEPNYPAISDGVLIMRDDELVAVRPCAGGQADMPVQYDAAEWVFAQEDELFTDETMRADPDWSRE